MTTRTAPPLSEAEMTLAVQLEQAGIPFEREFRFAPPRRWRADFAIRGVALGGGEILAAIERAKNSRFLVEVEGGSFTGGHKRGKAYESDCEKNNAAMLGGWQVYRFTPAMVADGRALDWIQQALR